MAFVNVKQVYNNVKIVKFFSPDCYPHIFNNIKFHILKQQILYFIIQVNIYLFHKV